MEARRSVLKNNAWQFLIVFFMNIQPTHYQNLNMPPFQAAERLSPAERRKPAATSSFYFLPDGRRLELVIPSPNSPAMEQFCQGAVHMALVRRGFAAVLLYSFGNLPWQVAIFNGEGLGHERLRVFKALARERSSPLQFSAAIIDRDTQALRAMRPVTLSPLFASMIGRAMRAGSSRIEDSEQAADHDWLMTQHSGDLLGLSCIYERAVALPVEMVWQTVSKQASF